MKYTVADGFPYYIELIDNLNYRQAFSDIKNISLLESLSETQASYRYAAGKWSIKQIIGHITDHERIMMYRALRFSRNDTTALPGYDQNILVENSRFDELSLDLLITDLKQVRASSNSFINMLSPEQLARKGFAWKYELTVEEFLKAAIGHEMHHMTVIRNKYLTNV